MTTIYLTRHGQTEWNVEGRMQGSLDSPLTAVGEEHARLLGERLADIKIDYFYSSPSERAYHTAQLIRGDRDLEILTDDRLKEINMGDWEGKLANEIEKEDLELFHSFWYNPQLYISKTGESFHEVKARVTPFLEEIITKHPKDHIMIVTHTVVLKTLMAYFDERPIEKLWEPPFMHPTSLSKVIVENDKDYQIILHADTSHFKE